jgi:hypothetical protein
MILSLLNFISIFSQNGLTFDTFLPSYNFTTNYYNHSFLPQHRIHFAYLRLPINLLTHH